MSRKQLPLLAFVLWLPISCATLDVKVDIYRGADPVLTASALRTVDYALANFNTTQRREIINTILDSTELMVRQEFDKLPKPPKPFENYWNGQYLSIENAWREGDVAAAAAVSEAKELDAMLITVEKQLNGVQTAKYRKLLDAVNTAKQKRIEFDSKTRAAFGKMFKSPEREQALQILDEADKSAGVRQIAASDDVEGRAVGTPLFDKKIALLSQKGEDWESFTTNHFQAFWGTAQFVVVREGLLVYHQKNLDFDPTPAVGAGTAVSKLGLKVAAALATGLATGGVGSVPGLQAAKGGDGQGAGSQAVLPSSVDEGRIEIDRKKLDRWREARRNLLMSIANLMERKNASPELIKGELKSEIDFYRQRISNSSVGRQP
jgi:hypothetical protein